MGNVRVRGHDYRGKGYYFITFGTLNRRRWLSRIEKGRIHLEPAGELLMDAWGKIAKEAPAYELGVTAVMPDHFHGLAIARKPPKYVIDIPIGGFISPGEREVASAIAKLPRARIIKLLPWRLKRYKPSGSAATRWLAEGHTLILTGFSHDEPVECRRKICLRNNEWVKQIAAQGRMAC